MALEDEDFDLIAGSDDTDDGAADEIAELDTGDEDDGDDNDTAGAMGGEAEGDAPGGDAPDEAGAEADREQASETQGGQQVPLAVLLDERKSFQARLDEFAGKAAKFDAFMERAERIKAEKEAEAEKEPEPEYLDDPKAYVDHKTAEARRAAEETRENVTRLREMTESQQQVQQIVNRLQTSDTEFINSGKEDLYDAIEHVRNINIQNGIDMGLTRDQAEQEAAKAMFMTQAQVLGRGKNPSEYIYNLATRWGYKKAVAEDATKEDPDKMIEQGQAAQSMGGGEAPGKDEFDEELDDSEFAEAMGELFGKEFVR